MALWFITLGLNLFLCLLLLYKSHHTRYRALFLSLIFEIFAAPTLFWIYSTYGVDSSLYDFSYHVKKFLTILFAFAIIFEGFTWHNRCVRVPSEIYLFLLLCVFLADRAQFFKVSWMLYEVLRYANVAILLWWTSCFWRDTYNEKRAFRARARPSP